MQRMRTIAGHFVAPAVGANISTLHPNDDTVPDALLEAVITRVLKETGIDPKYIGDIAVGNVLAEGSGAAMARMAQFRCGLPETVPLHGVNRMCSSGLQAVMNIAAGIKAGLYDAGLGCGMESMSVYKQGSDTNINPKSFEFDKARDCMIPMGITSENVAEQYGITREMQDKMGYESQTKAKRARDLGNFKEEIVPVTTTVLDKDGDSHEVTVSQDEGIRDTTMAGLTKLRPAFKKDGTTTAGNSSQVSDGAAAVLLMKRSLAERLRLPVLGRIISYAVAGVPPRVMGIGPAEAIPKALEKAGLTINDIDVFEINEAFASQATYCVQKLGIPMEKVNPNGGAIALGHPLGCTGARQVPTLLYELKRRRKRAFGVISMCIGTGMGAAAVLEYPGTV